MKFFSFWRSLASFRVRIALNLKNLPAEVIFVDLDADAHHADEYCRINPQMALMVACEGHPLLTPRVRRYLDRELNLRDEQQAAWRRHWTIETMTALEGHLAGHRDTGRFCHGDAPTLADICMVGHVTVANTQQIALTSWPT